MNPYKETPSELLNLLVDGELDSSQQSELFSELHQNEELRREYDELLAIRKSVRKDIIAFTPPAEAGKAIFQRLGFAPPYLGNIVKTPLLRRFWLPVASALVASLFTAILFTNSDYFKENILGKYSNTNVPVSYSSEKQNTVNINENNSSGKISIVNKDNSDGNSNFTDKNRVQTLSNNGNTANLTITGNQHNNTDLSLSALPNEEQIHTPELELFVSTDLTNGAGFLPLTKKPKVAYITNPGGTFESPLSNSFQLISDKNGKVLLILRGIAAESFQNVPDETNSTIFSNLSIGGFYKISNNFRLGAELSQEPFAQSFSRNGNIITQNPMLLCFAAGARYEANEIHTLFGAQPYIQLLVGGAFDSGAITGSIGKTQVGLQWLQRNGFGAFIGGEFTGLIYKNESEMLFTSRAGFTFGIAFSF